MSNSAQRAATHDKPEPVRSGRPRVQLRVGPSTLAAAAAIVVLSPLYLATAAPDLTFWDAAEFMTAAHTLGIPHPPGTPMWVVTAKASVLAFGSHGPARAVTLLSVVATVLACALGARLIAGWLHGRSGAASGMTAAIAAGTVTSVWSNATETEVYAMSLLLAVAIVSAGSFAGEAGHSDDQRRRGRALVAFLAGLAVPLHLSALVALPAAMVLALHAPRVRVRDVVAWVFLALLGLSAVAVLPVRASFAPELNVGNPVTLSSLWAVLTRAQYAVAGLWPRRAPLWIQAGNLFQWADWQIALGLQPTVGPSWVRTPLTVLWGVFGAFGLRHLWHVNRRAGRGMCMLLLCGTFGVVVWLNLRAGPSFGHGVLPPGSLHEARERDYFFALGFWTWGLLAGTGIASGAARVTAHMKRAWGNGLRAALLGIAALPLVANASVMNRAREPESLMPRMLGRLLLQSVPPGGVLVVAGDNDTYPLLYLQQVEGVRTDVVVVTAPLLGAAWHREALAKRGALPDGDIVNVWRGDQATLRAIGNHTASRRRPLRASVYLSARERNALQSDRGWMLQGVVYAPSELVPAGAVGLDLPMLARVRSEVPPAFLKPVKDFDGTVSQMQRLLRCTTITALDNPLLAGPCNGS